MTSPTFSSKKTTRFAFKHSLIKGIPVVIPLVAISIILSIVNLRMDHSNFAFRFFGAGDPYMESGNIMVIIVLIFITAVGLAMNQFKFLTKVNMSNVYFSIGMSRRQLFLSSYSSGAVLLSAGTLLVAFAAFLSSLGGSDAGAAFSAAVYLFFCFLLFGLFCYTICAAVFSATGTQIDGTIFSVILIAAPSVLTTVGRSLFIQFWWGYGTSYLVPDTTAGFLRHFSPVSMLSVEMQEHLYMMKQTTTDAAELAASAPKFSYWLLAIYFVVIIAIAFLALHIFKKRKAEYAGRFGANRFLNHACSLLAGVLIFSLFLEFARIFRIRNISVYWLLLILSGCLFIGLLVCHSILLRNFKQLLKTTKHLAVQTVAVLLITALFLSNLFGLASNKLPAIETIQSADVTTYGVTPIDSYNLLPGEISNISASYATNTNYLLGEFTSVQDLETILSVNKSYATLLKDKKLKEIENKDETIVFSYTLKNGKTKTFTYNMSTDELYSSLLKFYETEQFRKTLAANFDPDIITPENWFYNPNGGVSYYAFLFSGTLDHASMLDMTEEQNRKLLQCLSDDFASISLKDYFDPQQRAEGVLTIPNSTMVILTADGTAQGGEFGYYEEYLHDPIAFNAADASSYFSDYGSHKIYLFSSMQNTLSYLAELGYAVKDTTQAVKSATIFKAEQIALFPAITHYGTTSRQFFSSYANDIQSLQEWEEVNMFNSVSVSEVKDQNEKIRKFGGSTSNADEIAALRTASRTYTLMDDSGYLVFYELENGKFTIEYLHEHQLPDNLKASVFQYQDIFN